MVCCTCKELGLVWTRPKTYSLVAIYDTRRLNMLGESVALSACITFLYSWALKAYLVVATNTNTHVSNSTKC